MIELPTDVIQLIVQHISHTDVVNLSLLSRTHRETMLPFVWSRVKVPWFRLINGDYYPSEFVRELRIIDCYSYGEWHFDLSKNTIAKCPHLTHLLINSNSSSGWLKYLTAPATVHDLTLYYCAWHCETQSMKQKDSSIPVATLHPNHPRFFNLSHIAGFNSLSRLTLNDYTFNWEVSDTDALVNLSELSLVDCRWDYPFKLTSFNPRNSLQKLELHYTSCNAFILSERLNMFLVDDTAEIFGSITELIIAFYKSSSIAIPGDSTWEKHLNHRVFHKFISEVDYPRLKKLRLYGWFSNVANLRHYLRQVTWNQLSLLDLQLIHNFASEVGDVREECSKRFPDMELELKVSRELGNYRL